MSHKISWIPTFFVILFCSLLSFGSFGQNAKDFPPTPNPPRLVNDLAGVLSASEVANLEYRLDSFDKATSTQITIVTVHSVGDYDIAEYATELGNRWGVGRKGKNNGAVILAAINDRRINISTGYGLEGSVPDALAGRIIRNEITPFFKSGNYYQGFLSGAESLIQASKGEYETEPDATEMEDGFPIGTILFIFFIIFIFVMISRRGGGGGGGGKGGRYISRRGSDIFTGMILNEMMRGGRGSSGWGGGGFGGGGGGFGGFGGGSFGGGGASGSW